jgi:hypothetical protein
MDTGAALMGPLRAAWAGAGRPLAGMPVNGDAAWTWSQGPRLQVAVMDGLGHGQDAAAASQEACRCLDARGGQGLAILLRALHEALRRTRGAALSLADADLGAGLLRWCGIGNVQGCLAGSQGRTRLLNLGGIVGLNLPSNLLIRELPLAPGDLLLFCTDGVEEAFLREAPLDADPAILAPLALERYARAGDDALLWVGRFDA